MGNYVRSPLPSVTEGKPFVGRDSPQDFSLALKRSLQVRAFLERLLPTDDVDELIRRASQELVVATANNRERLPSRELFDAEVYMDEREHYNVQVDPKNQQAVRLLRDTVDSLYRIDMERPDIIPYEEVLRT